MRPSCWSRETCVNLVNRQNTQSISVTKGRNRVVVSQFVSRSGARFGQLSACRLYFVRSWPLLRAVQDSDDVERVPAQRVDHDVGQGRHHKFACALPLARSTAIRELQQATGRLVQPLESSGAPSATGLMFGQLLLQAVPDGFVRQHLPGVDLG